MPKSVDGHQLVQQPQWSNSPVRLNIIHFNFHKSSICHRLSSYHLRLFLFTNLFAPFRPCTYADSRCYARGCADITDLGQSSRSHASDIHSINLLPTSNGTTTYPPSAPEALNLNKPLNNSVPPKSASAFQQTKSRSVQGAAAFPSTSSPTAPAPFLTSSSSLSPLLDASTDVHAVNNQKDPNSLSAIPAPHVASPSATAGIAQ